MQEETTASESSLLRREKHIPHETKLGKSKATILGIVSFLLIVLIVSAFVLSIVIPKIIEIVNESKFVSQDVVCNWNLINLGSAGGLTEQQLSSFLLSVGEENQFIALDAGSLLFGINAFLNRQQWVHSLLDDEENYLLSAPPLPRLSSSSPSIYSKNTTSGFAILNPTLKFAFPYWATTQEQKAMWFLRNYVTSYWISHSHLDHVAALVHVSPSDIVQPMINSSYYSTCNNKTKPIVGSQTTLESIETNLFNDKIWPNIIKHTSQYQYTPLQPLQWYSVATLLAPFSTMQNVNVKMYPLCHEDVISNAFLFDSTESQIIYFGDTGPSSIVSNNCSWIDQLEQLWNDPALDMNKLKNIIIETSFANQTKEEQLFGHMRPTELTFALYKLAQAKSNSLHQLQVIITHIKPGVDAQDSNPYATIANELQIGANSYGLQNSFLLIRQGDVLCLK